MRTSLVTWAWIVSLSASMAAASNPGPDRDTEQAAARFVQKIVEDAGGRVEPLVLPGLQTLKSVDLAIANMGPHDKRSSDPYDAAFFTQLGKIRSLEYLNIIATKLNDETIGSLAELTHLKTLRLTNNGKLTDAGLVKLARLRQLEVFNFVGTGMQGHAFTQFDGWTQLTRCSFRGSSIDDTGLRLICEKFPNLESISLAHAKCTNEGVAHLPKLAKLKGLELGSRNATGACLSSLQPLSLEYLQVGDGLDSPEGLKAIQKLPTLRRLTLTGGKTFTDDDLRLVATFQQLEQLELGGVALTDERLPLLRELAFLKSLQLVNRPQGYSPETQAKIRNLLPDVEIKFP